MVLNLIVVKEEIGLTTSIYKYKIIVFEDSKYFTKCCVVLFLLHGMCGIKFRHFIYNELQLFSN